MNEINDTRSKNTAFFLKSYGIQKKMETVAGFDENRTMETAHAVQLSPQNSYDTNLQCGQIRLLSQLEHITYVVLLQRWEKDSFVAMTFSHYDFPATDEEFKPNFDGGMYLNVLQAWNTRTLQDDTLKKSWLIGNLPASDCSDAWDFWEHLMTGKVLKAELLDRTGLPIAAMDDPRVQYMREEISIFENLDNTELSEHTNANIWLERFEFPSLWNDEELALAAGDEKQDLVIECTPYGHGEFVTIVFSYREKILRVNIYTPDQSKISHSFDAWELITEDGSVLGLIQDGSCVVHELEAFDGKCALRNPEDHTVVIFEKRQE